MDVEKRIELLEKKVADLERQIHERQKNKSVNIDIRTKFTKRDFERLKRQLLPDRRKQSLYLF